LILMTSPNSGDLLQIFLNSSNENNPTFFKKSGIIF
jgi:hypothetical protein